MVQLWILLSLAIVVLNHVTSRVESHARITLPLPLPKGISGSYFFTDYRYRYQRWSGAPCNGVQSSMAMAITVTEEDL
eukprot:3418765-Amphidinium_carterae.1